MAATYLTNFHANFVYTSYWVILFCSGPTGQWFWNFMGSGAPYIWNYQKKKSSNKNQKQNAWLTVSSSGNHIVVANSSPLRSTNTQHNHSLELAGASYRSASYSNHDPTYGQRDLVGDPGSKHFRPTLPSFAPALRRGSRHRVSQLREPHGLVVVGASPVYSVVHRPQRRPRWEPPGDFLQRPNPTGSTTFKRDGEDTGDWGLHARHCAQKRGRWQWLLVWGWAATVPNGDTAACGGCIGKSDYYCPL